MNSEAPSSSNSGAPSSLTSTTAVPTSDVNNSSNKRTSRKRPLTSDVYEFFTRKNVNGHIRYQCVSCASNYSANSATTTLRNHARKHGFLMDTSAQQQAVISFGERRMATLSNERNHPAAEMKEKVLQQICSWVCSATLPFSVVENEEFIKLIRMFDVDFVVPNRRAISNRISAMVEDNKVSVRSQLSSTPGNISLTTDAWSSRIYRGYIAVTAHWIDEYWSLRSVLLDFQRFPTPHTADATCTTIIDILENWHVAGKVQAITTDNAADVISGVNDVHKYLCTIHHLNVTLEDFHVRCIAHVVNLAVKDALEITHAKIAAVRNLVHACRCSIKRRDRFEEIKKSVGSIEVSLPTLDVQTRWSSTFIMVKNARKARLVLNTMCDRMPELKPYKVSDTDWEHTGEVCSFLETAAAITTNQSGRSYVTLSLSYMAFKLLMKKCRSAVQDNSLLKPIAEKMLEKLKIYEPLVCSSISSLSKTLDPRFGNDVITDGDLLRQYLGTLPPSTEVDSESLNTEEGSPSFLQELFDSNSIDRSYGGNDEVSRFIRATASGDRHINPLDWWKTNESRFPNIAKLARNVFAIQATSVASESIFSEAGNLVDDHRCRLSDDSIRSTLLLKSWVRNKLL